MKELKEDWQEVRLGDVVYFNPTEKLIKGNNYKKIPMDCLIPKTRKIENYEVNTFNGGSKFRNGDTLMARITPCLENGKTAQVSILEENEIAFGSTEFIVLREKENISDNNFIYYLFNTDYIRSTAIKSMTGTSGRQRVQEDVLKNTIIKLPPLEEQKKIASILSSLDDKIELNNRMNKILEETAQTIFKEWFINFNFPNEEGKPYKKNGGNMIESELGEIPCNFQLGILDEIIELFDNKRIPLSNMEREKKEKIYPYYGAASLMDYVDDYIFDGTYILLGEDGTVIDSKGYPILQYVYGKFWVNNHAHVIKAKSGFNEESLFILLRNINVRSIVTGAVQPKINQNNLKSLKIIIPDKKLIENYNQISKSIFNIIKSNQIENQKLAGIRDSILPKLMSGEIRIK